MSRPHRSLRLIAHDIRRIPELDLPDDFSEGALARLLVEALEASAFADDRDLQLKLLANRSQHTPADMAYWPLSALMEVGHHFWPDTGPSWWLDVPDAYNELADRIERSAPPAAATDAQPATADDGPWYPSKHYSKKPVELPSDSLRSAYHKKQIRARKIPGTSLNEYHDGDVRRRWPHKFALPPA